MPDTARLATALEGRYRIERELGAGGMATVYLAKDLKHDREVALKVLRPELGAVLGSDRFLSEIKITARLDHPHILTLIDSGASEGFLYYVLPYVRGESLRDLLNREKQLGVDQALQITKQVASALDYAHRQGVVHRDIKPENILIQEGEAMLADFGIALAVKEAGGNRLTETGLSLGTPQYMSPEQATGDRQLDARSDVYSLGAVLYEMLAGEPPVTGPTAQAMIAKLMTERPTRLRIVRDTVPDGIDSAVAKALSKVPADRFAGAGEFARALAAGSTERGAARGPSRAKVMGAVAAGVIVVAVLGVLVGRKLGGSAGPAVALRDRSQLTFTGRIRDPAISPDGKQLAYVTRSCGGAGCVYAVEIQDVGGTATHRVLDGATAAYELKWSPDRRNLVFIGSVHSHYGSYLVSALGGVPRLLTAGTADFFAGGDSLLITRAPAADSAFWVLVTALDGVSRDSVRIAGPGSGLVSAVAVPGTSWIVAAVARSPNMIYHLVDRHGRESDRRTLATTNSTMHASADALWVLSAQPGASATPIVRVPLDAREGRFGARVDTVYASGTMTGFGVTADGASIVLDEGTSEYGAWVADFRSVLRGALPADRALMRASSPMKAMLSPDGARLAVLRVLGSASGETEQLAVLPSSGGTESPMPIRGRTLGSFWADSVTLALAERLQGTVHFSLVDARTSARRAELATADSAVVDFSWFPGGWAWIAPDGQSIRVQRGGETTPRLIAKTPWYLTLISINASPDGQRLAYTGWDAATWDSLRLATVATVGGAETPWATVFAEGGTGIWLADGSLLYEAREGQETMSLYHLRAPGRSERLGTIPRPVATFSVTTDLKRAAVTIRDYHGDAWMSRVVRP